MRTESVLAAATVVAAVWLPVVSAFLVLSKQTTEFSINGTTVTIPSATFTCQSSDASMTIFLPVQNGDGTISPTSHYCHGVFHEALVQLRGVNPYDGVFELSEVVLARFLGQFAAQNSSEPATLDLREPMGRRLLQQSDGQSPEAAAISGLFHFGSDGAPIEVYTGYGDNTQRQIFSANNVTGALCTQFKFMNSDQTWMQRCMRGPNFDVMGQITDAEGNFTSNLGTFVNDVTDLTDAQASTLLNITKATGVILSAQNTTQYLLNSLTNSITLLNSKSDDTQRYVTAEIQAQLVEAAGVSNSTAVFNAELAQLAQVSATDFDRLTLLLTQSLLAVMTPATAGINSYRKNRKLTILQQLQMNTAIGDAASTMRAFTLDTQMIRGQNHQLQGILTKWASQLSPRGETLTAFLEDEGVPAASNPLNLPSQFRFVPMANDFVRDTVVDGGVPYGVVTTIVAKAESKNLVDAGLVNPDYHDISTAYGVSCDETFQAPTFGARCKLVDIVTEIRCVLRNTGGVVSAGDLDQFYGATSGPLLDSSTGCLAASQPYTVAEGGLDGTVIRSATQSVLTFAAMSRRPYYTGTVPRTVSLFTNTTWTSPRSTTLSNTTTFMEGMNDPQRSLFFDYWIMRQQSWSIVMGNLAAYEEAYYGRIPNYTYQKSIPYRLFKAESVGRTTHVGMMFYSTPSLTLSSLTLGQTSSAVDVGFPGQNRPNVTATNVIVNSPYLYQLNEVVEYGTGILWDPATFQSRFFNLSPRSISLSPHRDNRRFKANYASVPEAHQFRRDYWSFLAGGQFEHEAGGNLPWPYLVERDAVPSSPTFGQCTTAARAPGGPWCVLFQNFRVTALGTFNDPNQYGRMIFEDLSASVTYTAELELGTPVFRENTTCPEIRFITTVSNATRTVVYQAINPLGTPSTFGIQQTGACPFSRRVDAVAPGASVTVVWPICNGDVVTGTYLTSSGAMTPCAASRTINITTASLATAADAASLNMTDVTHIRMVDTLYSYMTVTSARLLLRQAQTLKARLGLLVSRGASAPTAQLLSLNATIADLKSQAFALIAASAVAANNTRSIANQGASKIDAALAASIQLTNALQQQQRQDIDKETEAAQTVSASVKNVGQLTAMTDSAAFALARGFETLGTSVVKFAEKRWNETEYGGLGAAYVALGDTGDGAGTAECLLAAFGGNTRYSFSRLMTSAGSKCAILQIAIFLLLLAVGVPLLGVAGYAIYERSKGPRTSTWFWNSYEEKEIDRRATAALSKVRSLDSVPLVPPAPRPRF